eukprot:g6091.t1
MNPLDYITWVQSLAPGERGAIAPQAYGGGEYMAGAFFYVLMYYVGHVLYMRALPTFERLHGPAKAQFKQFDFCSRVGSCFHSSAVTYLTWVEYSKTDVLHNWCETFSPSFQRVLAFSSAYFAADFVACAIVASERGIARVGLATLVHHITTIAAQTAVLVYSGPKLLTLGLMWTEGTTTIVNFRWYLLAFGHTGWLLQLMNVVMTLSFLIIRIPVCTVCTSAVLAHLPAMWAQQELPLFLACAVTVPVITVLNYYWIGLMFAGITRGGKHAKKDA